MHPSLIPKKNGKNVPQARFFVCIVKQNVPQARIDDAVLMGILSYLLVCNLLFTNHSSKSSLLINQFNNY